MREQRRQLFGFRLVGRELDELDPAHPNALRHRGNVDRDVGLGADHLVHQVDQRAAAIDGDRLGRAAAELVVEDLERQRPVIAGGGDGAHEVGDRQIALARHVAEVAAPVEQVHVDARSVGELHDEDAIAGDGADRPDVDAPRQRVEGIEDQPDVRMIGAAHDLPGVAMVVDVAAPGQRLVADAKAASRRPLAELAEIVGGAVDAAERERRDVGADEHQVGAELLHQVELALGPIEGARPLRLRQALEIAERLEQRDLEPVVAHHAADLRWRAVEGEEVVLEDLDAVETGRRDRCELLARSPLIDTVAIEVFIVADALLRRSSPIARTATA